MTALYEIVPAGTKMDLPKVDALKYSKPAQPGSDSGELCTVKIRFKAPAGETSELLSFPITDSGKSIAQANADARFVAAVAELGLLLRDSPHRGSASWAETDLQALFASQPAEADESTGDKKGPISIAVAATGSAAADSTTGAAEKTAADPEAPKPQARVIVVGDSDFGANSYLGFQGNGDLFMNTIGWLTQQENLISIRPKEAADRRLSLTASQTYLVSLLALVVVPGVVFGTGVYSWWRRR